MQEKFLAVLIIIPLRYLELENCGVPIQVLVMKYRDYVTIYIPLDSHGDITEFLDAILVSLEIHAQIVAWFSEFIPH